MPQAVQNLVHKPEPKQFHVGVNNICAEHIRYLSLESGVFLSALVGTGSAVQFVFIRLDFYTAMILINKKKSSFLLSLDRF